MRYWRASNPVDQSGEAENENPRNELATFLLCRMDGNPGNGSDEAEKDRRETEGVQNPVPKYPTPEAKHRDD